MKYHYQIHKNNSSDSRDVHSDSKWLMTRDKKSGLEIDFEGFILPEAAETAGRLIRDFYGLSPDSWCVTIYPVPDDNKEILELQHQQQILEEYDNND